MDQHYHSECTASRWQLERWPCTVRKLPKCFRRARSRARRCILSTSCKIHYGVCVCVCCALCVCVHAVIVCLFVATYCMNGHRARCLCGFTTHTHTHTHANTARLYRTQTDAYTCTRPCMLKHACVRTRTHTRTHSSARVCTHTHARTQANTCTLFVIHTYTRSLREGVWGPRSCQSLILTLSKRHIARG